VPLAEAVASILALYDEFVFTAPADKSRAVAHLLGPAFRFGKLLGRAFAPVAVKEAKETQTGKGYQTAVDRAPYRAEAYDVVQRMGGVGSLDETIAQAILAGRPFIALENMRGRLDSTLLEHALTSHELFPVRVPYKATVRVDVSRTMFQLTSNGVEGTVDLAARMLLVRLEKRRVGTFKQFPEGDLLDHVRARAGYYLGCIFAVIRRWHSAGKPRLSTPHSFREWMGTMDWIVQRLFRLPPLLDGHESALQRIANIGLSWLRLITAEVMRRGWCGRALAATELMQLGHDINAQVSESDDEQKQLMAVGRRLAEAFAECSDDTITVEGVPVRRTMAQDNAGHPIKRYTFGEAEL